MAEYSDKLTLRVGVSADYQVSQALSIYGGVDVISASFDDGNQVSGVGNPGDADETLVNAYIGAGLRFTENLTGNITYNYTNSDSDIPNRDYDRNRISVGVEATF